MNRLRLILLLALAWALVAGPAGAVPVAVVATAIYGASAVAAGLSAAATFVAIGATIVINTAISMAINFIATKLFAPDAPAAQIQARQASVTQISLGESSREFCFGKFANAGSLIDGGNYGGQYGTDWELLVVQFADHEITAIDGFWINDAYHEFAGDGLQAGFGDCLEVHVRLGLAADTPPAICAEIGWTAADKMRGAAYAVVAYKYDEKEMSSRPSFLFVGRGAKLYDPRKDSTVPGGSGLHRWADPSTWEFSENLYLARYNWNRGIYALRQVDDPAFLVAGRGLSALEAPPERAFAALNLCDEEVAKKDETTEPRYHGGGVIRSTERPVTTEEMFAAAMAGVIVQREGGVEIEPGEARSSVCEITDSDLQPGRKVVYSLFVSDREKINQVAARYIEPTKKWSDTSAPIRGDDADVLADGGPNIKPLNLDFVTSVTHAQRCAEIQRRQGRLERRMTIPLGPRFADLEEGDVIGYTSERYFDGARIEFRIEKYTCGVDYQMELALREISADVYLWTPEGDEEDDTTHPVVPPDVLNPVEVDGFDVAAKLITAADGSKRPGVILTWDTPVDSTIKAIRAAIRSVAEPADVSTFLISDINSGREVVTNGVQFGEPMEARLLPIAKGGRFEMATSWLPFTAGDITGPGPVTSTSVTPGLKKIILGWTNPTATDFASYEIHRSSTAPYAGGDPIHVGRGKPGAITKWVDDDPLPGDNFYRVTTYDRTGNTGGIHVLLWDEAAVAEGITPPATPTGLALSQDLVLDDDGKLVQRLTATWDANTEADLAGYLVAFQRDGNGYKTRLTDTTRFEWDVAVGEVWQVKLKAYDKSGNKSTVYSSVVQRTITDDSTAPGPVTSPLVVARESKIVLYYINPTNKNFGSTLIERTSGESYASPVFVSEVFGRRGQGRKVTDDDPPAVLAYYWATTVSKSGKVSATHTLLGSGAPLNGNFEVYIAKGAITAFRVVLSDTDAENVTHSSVTHNSNQASRIVGLSAQGAVNGANVFVQSGGWMTDPSASFTPGGAIWLTGTDGQISQSKPKKKGRILLQVGVAKTATRFRVGLSDPKII